MTRNSEDPGFWRRGLSSRAQVIIAVVAGLVVVGAIIAVVASGGQLF